MPTVITFSPLQPPVRKSVLAKGTFVGHECKDTAGHKHRQRLALGSVNGVFYLDALCLHCGAHLVWVEDDDTPDEELD